METIFWCSFFLIGYVYFGYPAVLLIWRQLRARPVGKKYAEPTVSIVIAAHNERNTIEKKLQNCLSLDYPRQKLQIIVSLDGPTDGSQFLVWKFAASGIELVHSKQHTGKAAALNRAMRRATGEIVVFADVRQTFDRRAIRELVANFADEQVGCVSGELLLMDHTEAESITDVGIYWRYEKTIRSLESDIHSIAGATGAIYAIRRELFQPLPEDTLLDDVVTPLRITLRGMRTVFDAEAKAYDVVACCPLAEYGRKVRTLAGNYQLLRYVPAAIAPWKNPIFVQFVSHKLGRLIVPWAMLALFISNLFMLRGVYALTFLMQIVWYGFAGAGYLLSKREIAAPVLITEESKRAA